jgi:hypothetical protein
VATVQVPAVLVESPVQEFFLPRAVEQDLAFIQLELIVEGEAQPVKAPAGGRR